MSCVFVKAEEKLRRREEELASRLDPYLATDEGLPRCRCECSRHGHGKRPNRCVIGRWHSGNFKTFDRVDRGFYSCAVTKTGSFRSHRGPRILQEVEKRHLDCTGTNRSGCKQCCQVSVNPHSKLPGLFVFSLSLSISLSVLLRRHRSSGLFCERRLSGSDALSLRFA